VADIVGFGGGRGRDFPVFTYAGLHKQEYRGNRHRVGVGFAPKHVVYYRTVNNIFGIVHSERNLFGILHVYDTKRRTWIGYPTNGGA
jgi:hypothetical protein